MKTKTLTIAGHSITLIEGVRYIASRPFASRGRKVYPVTIQAAIGSPLDAGSVTLDGLAYDDANRFLDAFNNGPTSFEGRIW